jgi:hypothetical protein
MASNGDVEEEINDSNEKFVVATKCDFKRRTRPPKDHFEKILEAACSHHPYPIKQRLRDCTMMKKFMTSGPPSGSSKPGRHSGGKEAALVPHEVVVMVVAS